MTTELISDACNDLDDSQNHMEGKKSDTEIDSVQFY